MSDNATISTFQLFEMFPDQESARIYLESRLWPNGVVCPVCGTGERITVRKDGYYRCNQCKEDFTVRTGTIFERSHVPLHKWLYAMYLLVTARKGISSLQLSKEIVITQKSAWFVLHRLREAREAPHHDAPQQIRGRHRPQAPYLRGVNRMKPPKILDKIADKVLAYRPKPKSKPAKKRAKRKRLAEQGKANQVQS